MRKMGEVEEGAAYPRAAVTEEIPRVREVQVVRFLLSQLQAWARMMIRVFLGQFRIFV